MSGLSLETSFSLALLGTVSIGSIILMLMQATKQLFPSLEGQYAVWVTFLYALVAVALAQHQLGANLRTIDALIAVFLGGCAAFVAAVSQYAFLYKRSVEGLPPPPDAEASAEAFHSTDDPHANEGRAIAPAVMQRVRDDARLMNDDELITANRKRQ